jgi:hypothetical protein
MILVGRLAVSFTPGEPNGCAKKLTRLENHLDDMSIDVPPSTYSRIVMKIKDVHQIFIQIFRIKINFGY